jgi:Tfp pilus assembly protein PilO
MNKEQRTVAIFAVVFVILASVAYYFGKQTQEQVEQKKSEIAVLNKEIEDLQAQADQEEALLAELAALKLNFAQYVKILPSPQVATEEKLMETVQLKCERSNFTLVDYVAKPPRKRAKRGKKRGASSTGFKEIDVTLKADGTFEQFLRFLNSMERHESFLRVNSFQCQGPRGPETDAEGNETWPLKVTLNVSTFRYEAKK